MLTPFTQNFFALMPLIILSLIILPVTSYYLVRYWLLYSMIVSKPLTKVSDAKPGMVSVEGRAELYNNETVNGPTKKPCVWYHYTVRHGNRDLFPMRNHSKTPFILRDDTGGIIINPPEKFYWGELQLTKEDIWANVSSTNPQAERTIFAGVDYQWTEWRIEYNQNIYIYGKFKIAPQANSIYGEVSRSINSTSQFVISNLSRADLIRYLAKKIYLIFPCFAAAIILLGFVLYELIQNG